MYADTGPPTASTVSRRDVRCRYAMSSRAPTRSATSSGDIRVRRGVGFRPTEEPIKAGANSRSLVELSAGAAIVIVGDQIYHGDESNQNAPLPGYAVGQPAFDVRVCIANRDLRQCSDLFDKRLRLRPVWLSTGVNAPGIHDCGSTIPSRQPLPNPAAPGTRCSGAGALTSKVDPPPWAVDSLLSLSAESTPLLASRALFLRPQAPTL